MARVVLEWPVSDRAAAKTEFGGRDGVEARQGRGGEDEDRGRTVFLQMKDEGGGAARGIHEMLGKGEGLGLLSDVTVVHGGYCSIWRCAL